MPAPIAGIPEEPEEEPEEEITREDVEEALEEEPETLGPTDIPASGSEPKRKKLPERM